MTSVSASAEPLWTVAKTIADEAVSGDANKHAVTNMIDWPLGATTGRHSHPGDEYAVVIEGAVRVITDGQGENGYTAGEAYHNARGLVHETRTVGGVPAKTVAVFIVDKAAPITQPAPAR